MTAAGACSHEKRPAAWREDSGAHRTAVVCALGSTCQLFCPVPWLQLWFSEKTVLTVRRRYRQDGARRYEEVEGGLNKMSLAKFERIVKNSGLEVERLKYTGVKQLHFLTKIPGIREFMTNVVTVVLRAPA